MNYSLLSKLPLFRDIGESELERIFSELRIDETRFRKDELLAMQHEPCNRLVILLAGSVKGEMIDPSGRVVKVEDIEAPNPLAILFLFGRNSYFPVQVTAREEVTALVIPRPSVLRMLGMNETLLKNYLDISADFASRLSRKLHFMSYRTIRQKMAAYLLGLAPDAQSGTVRLDQTKSALAEYFGVSRPSLERELSNMQRDGLIRAENKNIAIPDRRELAALIDS